MASPVLEIARSYITAANDHDAAAMAALWEPGGIEEFPTVGQRHVAPLGIESHFASLFQSIPDVRFDLQRMAVEGECAFAISLMSGTHRGYYNGLRGSGRTFELLVGDYLTIRQGRIVANTVLFDGLSVLRQLAGFPPPGSKRERLLAAAINGVSLLRRGSGRQVPLGSASS